jgi:hypothetical protein
MRRYLSVGINEGVEYYYSIGTIVPIRTEDEKSSVSLSFRTPLSYII